MSRVIRENDPVLAGPARVGEIRFVPCGPTGDTLELLQAIARGRPGSGAPIARDKVQEMVRQHLLKHGLDWSFAATGVKA